MAEHMVREAVDSSHHKRARLRYGGVFSLYDDDHNPSSFRLEHHYKEETKEHRLVVFVAQRRGAIAKLIFSATTACDTTFTIHVLECKAQYRKCGLGSLLVMAALQRIQLLLRKSTCSSVVQLDAEEDESRYGRLVQFYTSFGFQLKPGAKISFLNNNCSEVYRKVPMRLDVGAAAGSIRTQSPRITQKFSPLTIQSGAGAPAEISLSKDDTQDAHAKPVAATDWILHWLDDEPRCVVFRTTRGSNLAIVKDDTDGSMSCYLSPAEDEHPFMIHQDTSESSVTIQSVATGEFLTLDPSSRQLRCHHHSCHWKLHNDTEQPHRLALTFCTVSPLRHVCFATAEAARRAALPDWLQLVALVYHKYKGSMDDDDNGDATACMMETLRASSLPHEGLAVLEHDWTTTTTSERSPSPNHPPPTLEDEAADCVAVVRRSQTNDSSTTVVANDCEQLWNSHYSHVCAKYGLSSLRPLEW